MPEFETDAAELARLAHDYRDYANNSHATHSPIYRVVCDSLADDPAIGGLALLAPPGFRIPLILPAVVHYLLLSGVRHPLGRYYPSIAGAEARPIDDGLYPAFADLVRTHLDAVVEQITTRTTQTNEVGRTALLVPPLGLIEAASGGPVALLEVGASAGLNLLLERYGFHIGGRLFGDVRSAVQIECAVRGELVPPLPERMPQIAWRAGLDLNPLDVRRPEDVAWLQALVWPEHNDRRAILDRALSIASRVPPRVVRGDLVDALPELARDVPINAMLVVVQTWVLAYVAAERRLAFIAAGRDVAAARRATTWLISCEDDPVLASLGVGLHATPPDNSALALHRFEPDGSSWHRLLAECHGHGRWIHWRDPDTGLPADEAA